MLLHIFIYKWQHWSLVDMATIKHKEQSAVPVPNLDWLNIKVGSEDIDIGIKIKGLWGLSFPSLPHLKKREKNASNQVFISHGQRKTIYCHIDFSFSTGISINPHTLVDHRPFPLPSSLIFVVCIGLKPKHWLGRINYGFHEYIIVI